MGHEHGDAKDADQKRDDEAEREALGAQENNFGERHEDGNGGEHDGGDSRGNALLGPEEQAVIENEDDQAE